ncbi:hypothetical protein [Planomonospora sp. ID82291]|uniref:hypothetical protein n=1 Tax=Planomonospora sp. ID82291 TaxID=2738136 RepID=UPI0018C40F08|nr:hypothetical protein [Planomonospora sp. ID82291]MBG0816640.1 hypothetical protein [Planomonospora sp. ID82291]
MGTSEHGVLHLGRTIENGISQWEAMASDLDRAWREVSAELKGLNEAAPWGSGPEGRAFASQYLREDGPVRLVESGSALVGQIVAAGPLLRRTIAHSRATDAAIAEALARGAKTVEA